MEYIASEGRLEEVAAELDGADLLAIDTEASGYHRFLDRLCLLQISTRSRTYVIDTLAVADLRPLSPRLEDPVVELVFHDADYDLRLLHRDFGVVTRGLFDSKIAAQFLGEPNLGLARLLEKYVDVRLEKKHQRADWARRPLPSDLIEYAAEDTRYLPALRDRLREELVARDRLAWAEEEFRIQESVRWAPNAGEAYLRLKGAKRLPPRQLAALRELFEWRETQARERDVAPFRVVGNEALIEAARRMPEAPHGLEGVPGLSPGVLRRHGSALIAAIDRARSLPPEELPERTRPAGSRPPLDPELDILIERLKAVRDEAAEATGLDRGFLMPRQQLERIAREAPRSAERLLSIPDVRRWQVEILGRALLAALRR